MADAVGVLVRQRERVREISDVLARYGFARLADQTRDAEHGRVSQRLVTRMADPDLAGLTTGQRLRGALGELGTTWVKFGQMLSLRPDLVGTDVAEELSHLQTSVPADRAGAAEALVRSELGHPVGELFTSFDTTAMASGSVAQVHRAELHDGSAVVVKVLHEGADDRVVSDLELMRALAGYLESVDPELARYSPTRLVAEFDAMMRSAIDFKQEMANLQRFTTNFADEPDVVIPQPYPSLSSTRVLTMQLMTGTTFTDRASVESAGWDVDRLVRRASDVYLEMMFRDGICHADPHPGNFLLPDGQHIAILDFGDVGYLSGVRKAQLETLLVAVASRDIDDLTDAVVEITRAPAATDVDHLRDDIDTWMSRYLKKGLSDLDLTGMIQSGMQVMHDNQLLFPSDLALLFRVMVRLQGLGQQVGTEVQVSELLQPYLEQMAQKRTDPQRLAHHAVRAVRSWERMLTSLPDDLRTLLAQVKGGRVTVDFQLHDPDEALDNLVDGVLAAASVLAASQLLAHQTRPLLGTTSVPGVVTAAVGALTWRRLTVRRSSYQSLGTRTAKLVRSR